MLDFSTSTIGERFHRVNVMFVSTRVLEASGDLASATEALAQRPVPGDLNPVAPRFTAIEPEVSVDGSRLGYGAEWGNCSREDWDHEPTTRHAIQDDSGFSMVRLVVWKPSRS